MAKSTNQHEHGEEHGHEHGHGHGQKYRNILDFKIKKNRSFVTITQKNRFLTDGAIFNFKNKCLPVKLTFKK